GHACCCRGERTDYNCRLLRLKLMETEWKNFKAAVKAKESARTSDTLSRLLTLSGQILTKKKSIYQYEQKIETIITRANAQLK
ncbi:hypothetical protein ACQKI4_27035, partial [Paenibacillus glucanolyticus]